MNYYGINRGQNQTQALVGTSTGSTDVEIRVDTSKITSRQDILTALELLTNVILQQPFP